MPDLVFSKGHRPYCTISLVENVLNNKVSSNLPGPNQFVLLVL